MNKKQMIEEAMGRIVYVQELQEAHLQCTQALQRRNRDFRPQQDIYIELMNWELHEWRGLMMWGLVADQNTQDRIKSAVHERFLADRMHVADWFHNGQSPGRWLSSEEKEFREMAKEAFAPKDNQ